MRWVDVNSRNELDGMLNICFLNKTETETEAECFRETWNINENIGKTLNSLFNSQCLRNKLFCFIWVVLRRFLTIDGISWRFMVNVFFLMMSCDAFQTKTQQKVKTDVSFWARRGIWPEEHFSHFFYSFCSACKIQGAEECFYVFLKYLLLIP